MKRALLFPFLFVIISSFAQPVTFADIKKHKIRKVLETTTDGSEREERFWYYDSKGFDSLQSDFDDTVIVYNTFKDGKLVKKLMAMSQKPEKDHVNEYIYEYNPDGSYKETYRDGAFGMKSYEWFDAKGKMQKSQSPDGNTSTYKYNTAGNLIAVTSDGKNGGMKISNKYSYNSKGQLIKKEMDVDGTKSVTTYEYNTKGQLVKEITKGGWEGENSETISTYEYNEKELMKKRITKGSESTSTVDYTYEFY